MRSLFIILVLIGLTGSACSSRVVYDQRDGRVSGANAININTATVDELEKLDGIGRATADNIIAYRTKNGAFRRVEHLMLVRGISEERFAELRSLIKID